MLGLGGLSDHLVLPLLLETGELSPEGRKCSQVIVMATRLCFASICGYWDSPGIRTGAQVNPASARRTSMEEARVPPGLTHSLPGKWPSRQTSNM